MTYRRSAWRKISWGGAAVLAGIGLAGCDSGGGGGGCPELEGSWQVQTDCASGPSSCEVDQNSSCEVTLICNNGATYEGKATKSSVRFEDDSVKCSGSIDDLEDEDEDGRINPTIEADCTATEGGGMCEVQAFCLSGDCTVPEDEDNGNDEGDGGGAAASGQGGIGGSAGGFSGQGGFSGAGPVGQGGGGGFGGSAGIPPAGSGGFSGEGGAGSGGVGGSVSNDCGSCVQTACGIEAASCTTANGCDQAATCLFGSGCYFDDPTCLEAACASVPAPTGDGEAAFEDVVTCTATNCQDYCPIFSDGPIAGSGGAGGEGGGPAPLPCDSCQWANDGVCDVPIDCDEGTDCTDCGTSGQ